MKHFQNTPQIWAPEGSDDTELARSFSDDQPTDTDMDKVFAESLSEGDRLLFWSLSGIGRYVVRRGLMTLGEVRDSRR